MSLLDGMQTLQRAFNDESQALTVLPLGSFVPAAYDEIDLVYVASGYGAGQIQTVTYKLAGNVINTLTISYNSSNNISSIVKS